MRRTAMLGLTAAAAVLAVSAPLVVIALDDDGPPAPPVVRTVPGCPQAPASVYVTPVHLVADLEHLVVRDSRWVAAGDRRRRRHRRRHDPRRPAAGRR